MHLKDKLTKVTSQNVLVVDDEPQVCDLLAEMLTFMGHQVDTAKDGVEAIDKLLARKYSILIADIDMPKMDGMELIQYLVEHQEDIDAIAITGHTMRYKYTDVIAAGATDFITKPFTLNELEAKLNRVIRERYLRHELERLAIQDPLTGLYNRRFFQKIIRREAVRAERYKHPLFLFFFDIDRFKQYNDINGHQDGDALLVHFARVLRASIRGNVDTAFRYGGDEFTVLLPHLPRERAAAVAERIRKNYNRLGFEPTAISIGIAEFRIKSGRASEDIEDMIHRADAALYRAKHERGGNCYCFDEVASAGAGRVP